MAAHTIDTLCDRLGCALASALRLPSTQGKEVAVIFRVDVQSFADVLTVLTKAEKKIIGWERNAYRQPAKASEGRNQYLCVLGTLSPCLCISKQNIGIHF